MQKAWEAKVVLKNFKDFLLFVMPATYLLADHFWICWSYQETVAFKVELVIFILTKKSLNLNLRKYLVTLE